MLEMAPGSRERKRCWNCRKLKIACDKTEPACHNCLKKGRVCLGYGLKLSWPRPDDKRRLTEKHGHYMVPVKEYQSEFIRTSSEDIEAWQSQALARYDRAAYNSIFSPQRLRGSIATLDPFLATNQYSPVARLISSSHDADNLYGLLVRLSLSDDNLPSLATRHAISALSYQHLNMESAAMMHQTSAIRALQAAIENVDPSRAMQMMAASMLLSIFETLKFDTSDLSWSIFFCGTKRIAKLVTQKHETYFGEEALIVDWIFYSDVMYKFSIRHWENKNIDQIQLASQEKILSKPMFAAERQIIVPTLGCSLELLDILCHLIDAVLEDSDPDYQSMDHMKRLRSFELRLQSLEQRHTGALGDNIVKMTHQILIADLFSLATLTYLYRLAAGEPADCEKVARTLGKAFSVLRQLEYCERPWPLFVLALEARTDEQRAIILRVLQGSLERKPLGTMALVNRMIHDAWVQQDLSDVEMNPRGLYNSIISRNRVPPCFT
ncbi:fungal-specific transcription factor domain-containing protein [Mariannaea sp. PMI_226]|nr:fungal-specific transcription factor domain-containing protein [Mariannaea sp. PMI_226]